MVWGEKVVLDSPDDCMVEDIGAVQPGSAGHDGAQASPSETGGATPRAFPNELLEGDRSGSVP